MPKGYLATTPGEAENIFLKLGNKACVVKAQILTGGRGKSGGVKIAETSQGVRKVANDILGAEIITRQTGSTGIRVKEVLVEEAVSIARELYLAFIIDTRQSSPVLVASTEGGVEIEEIASTFPEKIIKEEVDPYFGIHGFQLRRIASTLGIPITLFKSFSNFVTGLFSIFVEKDCSLLEINPLALTTDDNLCALDVKIDIDDNSLYRQHDILETNKIDNGESLETKAFNCGLSYIKLDGNIGCMVNGAGLAMATMDIIKLFGMVPANFLDVGGDASVEKVKSAFEIILSDKRVKGALVNIFGGIVKCDVIAKGIVQAVNEVNIDVPLVVRLEGTNKHLAEEILKASELKIVSANSMKDAAEKIVNEVKKCEHIS